MQVTSGRSRSSVVIDLTEQARVAGDPGRTSLAERVRRLAVGVGATVSLDETLRLLTELAHEGLGARGCRLFLLEGNTLTSAAAVTVQGGGQERATSGLGPFEVGAEAWEWISTPRPLVLDETQVAELTARHGLEAPSLGAIVVVPLVAGGRPYGLLTVDWPDPRELDVADLAFLEAVGACAGLAVHNARLVHAANRRARLQEAVARGAAALASPSGPQAVVERLVDAYTDLLDARLCAIALIDAARSTLTALATRGTLPIFTPLAIADIPDRIVHAAAKLWEHNRQFDPIELGDDPWLGTEAGGHLVGAARYLLVPLVVDGEVWGAILLGFAEGQSLDSEERLAVRALADIAAAVLERVMRSERQTRQFRQLDALYQASAALTDGASVDVMVKQLNELLAGDGVEVVSVAFRDDRLARRLGAEGALSPKERAAWRSGSDWATLSNGCASIPMLLGHRLVGALRVRPANLDPEDRAFLEALARGLAEVASRDALRAAVDGAERERALAAERERMAHDLHDSAGQLLVSIGLLADSNADQLPAGSPERDRAVRIAQLARQGKWEIDHAARGLSLAPVRSRGFVASLRALVKGFEADSGIEVHLEIDGRTARPDADVEQALYRVAHQALANAWRHAQCREVRVHVQFEREEISLRVADDGVGFGGSEPTEGVGMASMRRVLAAVGGRLTVSQQERGGVVVEARVPRRAT